MEFNKNTMSGCIDALKKWVSNNAPGWAVGMIPEKDYQDVVQVVLTAALFELLEEPHANTA